jgi:uracil phosphoribosyltransferase
MVRDRDTSRDDFIFFAERLSRLVVELGLAQLPFEHTAVTTPTQATYDGLTRKATVSFIAALTTIVKVD